MYLCMCVCVSLFACLPTFMEKNKTCIFMLVCITLNSICMDSCMHAYLTEGGLEY